MGCILSILCLIFFPFVYFWYHIRRAKSNLDDMMREQMGYRETNRQQEGFSPGGASPSADASDSSASPGGTGVRKPHIFKPGEGEYVDYKEMDDL